MTPTDGLEANAEMRAFAATMRQMYIALKNEDFTEQQALVIIGQTIAAGVLAASQNQEGDDD